MTKKEIESKGFVVKFTNGTGAGGQKRNRTLSVAVVQHIDTGLKNRCDDTRSSNKNMNRAYKVLLGQLESDNLSKQLEKTNNLRKQALANGAIRTYNYKTRLVKDHRSKRKADLRKILRGELDLM